MDHSFLPNSLDNRCCPCLASTDSSPQDDTRRFHRVELSPQSILFLKKATTMSGPPLRKAAGGSPGLTRRHMPPSGCIVTPIKIRPLRGNVRKRNSCCSIDTGSHQGDLQPVDTRNHHKERTHLERKTAQEDGREPPVNLRPRTTPRLFNYFSPSIPSLASAHFALDFLSCAPEWV